MSDLKMLYMDLILEHNKSPRNAKKPHTFTHYAKGHNPLCGDKLELWATIDQGNTIVDIGFEGKGCALCIASASLMSESVKNKQLEDIRILDNQFSLLLQNKNNEPDKMGRLKAFAEVWKYPARVKCVSLAWHTLNAISPVNDKK